MTITEIKAIIAALEKGEHVPTECCPNPREGNVRALFARIADEVDDDADRELIEEVIDDARAILAEYEDEERRTQSQAFVAEVSAVVCEDTLREAYEGQTLSDVVALHRATLKARLGGDYPKDEPHAISRLQTTLLASYGLLKGTWNELACGSEVLTDEEGRPVRVSDSRNAEDFDAMGYDIEAEIVGDLECLGWDVELGDWSLAQGESDASAPVKSVDRI